MLDVKRDLNAEANGHLELFGMLPDEPEQDEKRTKRRKLIRRAVVIGLLAVTAASAIVVKLTGSHSQPYSFAAVDRGDIVKTISATGNLQAVTTVQVGSQISGTIGALYADFNSQVKKGQVIARLDPAMIEAQLAQARANMLAAQAGVGTAQSNVQSTEAAIVAAEANVARLKSAVEDAKRNSDRYATLAKAGVIAQQMYDSAQAATDQAVAQYNQAVAQVNQTKAQLAVVKSQLTAAKAQQEQAGAAVQLESVNLSHTVITAPVDGVVIARNVDVGQTVAASLQAPTLFVIANDLSRMQVLANVDEADVGQLGADSQVSFTVDAFPRETFHGRISQIRLNPQTVQNVVTYTAVVDVANPELKLRPGMTANITAIVAQARDALRIPNAALRFRPAGDQTAQAPQRPPSASGTRRPRQAAQTVWKGTPQGLQPVQIQTGTTDGVYTQVLGGELKEGDRVVVGLGSATGSQKGPQPSLFGGGPRGGIRR